MISSFIGIPYTDKGRTLKACDCYGLVKLYYKDILDVELPETAITAGKPRRIMANYLKEISHNWTEVPGAQKHCVVAMCLDSNHPKLVTHFGVMIDDKKMLHILNKINSHVINVNDAKIKGFIKGFYKWQS